MALGTSYNHDFGMGRYPTRLHLLARRIANTTGIQQASVINAGVNGDTAAEVVGRLVHDVTNGAFAQQIISDLQAITRGFIGTGSESSAPPWCSGADGSPTHRHRTP